MTYTRRVTPLIILGCGYVGSRIARAALAAGRTVRVCSRSPGKLVPLGELGAEVKYVDAAMPKPLTLSLSGLPGATVIYSIPPAGTAPPASVMRAALQAAYGNGATCFIYFSSSGLYGAEPDDEAWVDEQTPLVGDDPTMRNVQDVEAAIASSTFDTLRTVILRLAPVYGGGRGVRERLRKGTYKLLDDGQHAISRIHIDDVVGVVAAAEDRAPNRSLFLVADDEPTTQADYARWLCDRLGLPMPPSRPIFELGSPRVAHRNRRIRNTHLKQTLGLTLRYPTFREGEAAIEAEETAAP